MNEEIKGILSLSGESEEFIKKVSKEESELGVKFSIDWELDNVSCYFCDKEDLAIGALIFDITEFQSILHQFDIDNLPTKGPSEEQKKQIEKDVAHMEKHPVKKEIAKHHK